jgi:hypothetical protein
VNGESTETKTGFNWRRIPITSLRTQFDVLFREYKEFLAQLTALTDSSVATLDQCRDLEKLWTADCPLFQRMVHMSLNRLTLKVTHDHEKELLRHVLKVDTFLNRRNGARKKY